MFVIKLSDREVKLEWGTYAMFLFCEANGENGKPLPLSGLLDIYDSNTFSLKHVITMVQAAYKSANDLELSTKEAAQMIDEGGGLSNNDSQILAFIKYMNKNSQPDITEEDKGEKKSE